MPVNLAGCRVAKATLAPAPMNRRRKCWRGASRVYILDTHRFKKHIQKWRLCQLFCSCWHIRSVGGEEYSLCTPRLVEDEHANVEQLCFNNLPVD